MHHRHKVVVKKPVRAEAVTLQIKKGPTFEEGTDFLHEILDQLGKVTLGEEKALDLSAAAFLKYGFHRVSWRGLINLTPTLNKLGNLEGMVASAEMRVAFDVLTTVGEKIGVVGTVVGLVDQTWQLRDRIVGLAESDLPAGEKIEKALPIVASIVTRSAADITLSATHFVPWVMKTTTGYYLDYAYEQIGHAEALVRQVTDPKNFEAAYMFVKTNIFLPTEAY